MTAAQKPKHERLTPTAENPSGAPEHIQKAIRDAFPNDASSILQSMIWRGDWESFYSFERWGMFVGVETDGYIHT